MSLGKTVLQRLSVARLHEPSFAMARLGKWNTENIAADFRNQVDEFTRIKEPSTGWKSDAFCL
jgi:hypothetical protein